MDKPVYALSIKQPWAWLICKGFKDIENRDWKLPQKWIGERIYIHAGKLWDKYHRDDIWWRYGESLQSKNLTYNQFCQWWSVECPKIDGEISQIIGEVTITGCVTESTSPWFVGKYGFTLSQPMLYNVSIPYKGKLGFFEVHLDESNRGHQTGEGIRTC